jgi:SAM-dependent methyltransferase
MADTSAPPLRIGSPASFSKVRNALRSAGFDEAVICMAFSLADMSDLASGNYLGIVSLDPTLQLFVVLFLFLDCVPKPNVESLLDTETLDAFLDLDILRCGDNDGPVYYSSVFFYPVEGFLIASDRRTNPDGTPFSPPRDIVFPAIHASTLRYLRLLRNGRASCALDLGTGSGIGALVLSESAEMVIASDITARSAHFADFNRLLNERSNITVIQGDLYTPFHDQSFDCIGAHLPFVPVVNTNSLIFRDGGETGEKLIRLAIQGLPNYLEPGGRFLSVCQGMDLREQRFEERVRTWLGDKRDEFDVTFNLLSQQSPNEMVSDLAEGDDSISQDDSDRLRERLDELGVTGVVYGPLVLRRRIEPTDSPITVRNTIED